MNYYLVAGGGLGDVFRNYFKDDPSWGILPDLKKRCPESHIKLISVCHNPQVEEFFRYHPYLDEKLYFPWELSSDEKQTEYRGDYKYLRQNLQFLNDLRWIEPVVYLSPGDEVAVKELQLKVPYLILHPFAGLGNCYGVGMEKWPAICEALVKKGYNLYVIGATYDRTNKGGIQHNIETWPFSTFELEGAYSLVNKLNARTACKVIYQSQGFIGSHSCWANIAWIFKIPTVVLFPSNRTEYSKSGDENLWAVREERKSDLTIVDTDLIETEVLAKTIGDAFC